MSRTLIPAVLSCLLLAVGVACSSSTNPQDLVEPPFRPPLAIGDVCVDVTPADADATITLQGEVMTQRCQSVTTAYSSSASVIITAPGFIAQTHDVPLFGGTETLTITLIGPPAS